VLISFKRFSAHCKVHRLSAMSCAKTAEPVEMHFGMLSQVGPGNMYYVGFWPIEMHCNA